MSRHSEDAAELEMAEPCSDFGRLDDVAVAPVEEEDGSEGPGEGDRGRLWRGVCGEVGRWGESAMEGTGM